VNEQRREQYAQESALQTPAEREQNNAHRRKLRNEWTPKNARKITTAAERPMWSEEHETLEKLATTSFENLKPPWMTSNFTLWGNCALRAANVMLGSSRVKGLLQATLFLSVAPRVRCKFRAYRDHHGHSMTTDRLNFWRRCCYYVGSALPMASTSFFSRIGLNRKTVIVQMLNSEKNIHTQYRDGDFAYSSTRNPNRL